jgi:multicomponent Na+:H+ antiporter subunit C
MNNIWLFYMSFAAVLLFIALYCLLSMRNLIKLVIGVVIGAKGFSLALVATGLVKKNILLAQALAISIVVVEVCVVAMALALIINIYRKTGSLDIRKLAKLKG